MKKNSIKVVTCLIACSMMFSSCIGSFGLWNKALAWNKGLSKSKFVNEIVFIAMHVVPVYEIAGIVDAVVLNTIEFWTGNNPVAANIGHTDKVMGQDGKQYLVKTTRHGYKITKPDGQVVNFTYNKADSTWNVDANGRKAQLMKMLNNGMVQISLNNGQKMDVTLNQQGVYQAEMAVDGNLFAAR
jgi:hypothetical protein